MRQYPWVNMDKFTKDEHICYCKNNNVNGEELKRQHRYMNNGKTSKHLSCKFLYCEGDCRWPPLAGQCCHCTQGCFASPEPGRHRVALLVTQRLRENT